MKIAVIIPTLNEAANIALLIPRIHHALKKDYEIVVVDDASTDGTQRVVSDYQGRYPVNLINRPCKMGLATAVIDGMNSVTPEAYIVMDGDLSHPPELLSVMRDKLSQCDLVVASRYIDGGGIVGWPIHRRMISRMACKLARGLTAIEDPVSGYFAIRASCLRGVELSPIGFKIGLECIVRASVNINKYTEIPLIFTNRKHGHSKMGPGEIIGYLKQLNALYKFMAQSITLQAKALKSGTVKT